MRQSPGTASNHGTPRAPRRAAASTSSRHAPRRSAAQRAVPTALAALTAVAALLATLASGCGPTEALPRANVYRVNPLDDAGQTTVVELDHLTSGDGRLSGAYVDVWNCVNESQGEPVALQLGGQEIAVRLCRPVQGARPGPDGSYLHITPPAADTDGKSSFAEVMMYYHITRLHEHYARFGVPHIDRPLRAVVNLQGFVDGFGRWIGFPNANYFPAEQTGPLQRLIGVDLLRGADAIVFGYNNLLPHIGSVNFSFDAMAIYHEYTHFAIGGARLSRAAADRYGLDASPLALNEALADYFPSSFLGTPRAGGTYTLGALARDLSRAPRCPDHLTGESHIDGEVASGAFWALRELLSAPLADAVLWRAVLRATPTTTAEQLARTILAELHATAPHHEAAAEQLLRERGLIGCSRLRAHEDFDHRGAMAAFSPLVEGTREAPAVFAAGVPAPVQYTIALAPSTKELTIAFTPLAGGLLGRRTIDVAVRAGGDPITYDSSTGRVTSSAHAVVSGNADGEESYRLVLTGSCLAAKQLVFQFVNRGAEPVQLVRVEVTQRATAGADAVSLDGC